LGRQAQQRDEHLRLAAAPKSLPTPRKGARQAHGRPVRLKGEPLATTLQRQVERSHRGGGGLPTPSGPRMVKRGKLVQPTVVPSRRSSRKAKAAGGSGHRDCAQVTSLPVVPTARGDGLRDRGDASRPESFLSAAARGARGGRSLRMERHGFQNPTRPGCSSTRSI
jgi:hypothetical protein